MNLEINNLKFNYKADSKVLDGVDLLVKDESTIAIVGISGCGKSTLLRLIAGITTKSKENLYEGVINIEGLSPVEYKKKGDTSIMFQNTKLLPNLDVSENIQVPLKIKHIKDPEKVNKLIKMVGLSGHEGKLPRDLSGGMITRVGLARTFAPNSKLMLLDEPLSGLDVSHRSEMLVELEKLKSEFSTNIIYVTHDIEESLIISNHIIVMSLSGKILKELIIEKPLPRAIDKNSLKEIRKMLPTEYDMIYDLIMADKAKYGDIKDYQEQ